MIAIAPLLYKLLFSAGEYSCIHKQEARVLLRKHQKPSIRDVGTGWQNGMWCCHRGHEGESHTIQ